MGAGHLPTPAERASLLHRDAEPGGQLADRLVVLRHYTTCFPGHALPRAMCIASTNPRNLVTPLRNVGRTDALQHTRDRCYLRPTFAFGGAVATLDQPAPSDAIEFLRKQTIAAPE